VRNVFVRLESGGVTGFGEASPNAFYGESADGVKAQLDEVAEWLANREAPSSAASIREIWREMRDGGRLSRAAQCALDVALWDLVAKRRGISVTELAFGAKPRPIRSFATIGLSDPEELSAKIAALRDFPLIKLKSGRTPDAETARLVLAGTSAEIAIDANCAWEPDGIVSRGNEIAGPRVLFLEQPLPPEQDDRMATILAESALPIMADESCVTPDDVAGLVGRFSGFNIKLVKCGGLTPAFEMLERGRALGLRVMVGCMLESSLLVAAGAVIAQRADFADLDGAWLLRDDPFEGLPFDRGILSLRDGPGLGVVPTKDLFAER
jgi:L-alanine-DL-glutamate epimerase-like enolase superfamily enzyme